jgi:ribosomal-protein-alanine N-acetyltransferase
MRAMPLQLMTSRLLARPPTTDDVPAMLALYGRPEVAAGLYPDGRPRTEEQLRRQLEADVAHWRAHGFGRFLWQERATGEVVARCGPKHAFVGDRSEIDLHWAVRADRQRRGLAREAASEVVRACFAALGVASVTALAHVDNLASQRVARRLGFADEGEVDHMGMPHRVFRRRAG